MDTYFSLPLAAFIQIFEVFPGKDTPLLLLVGVGNLADHKLTVRAGDNGNL
jgi:hypothetical protein